MVHIKAFKALNETYGGEPEATSKEEESRCLVLNGNPFGS
jgi:hypothetical protein